MGIPFVRTPSYRTKKKRITSTKKKDHTLFTLFTIPLLRTLTKKKIQYPFYSLYQKKKTPFYLYPLPVPQRGITFLPKKKEPFLFPFYSPLFTSKLRYGEEGARRGEGILLRVRGFPFLLSPSYQKKRALTRTLFTIPQFRGKKGYPLLIPLCPFLPLN